MPQSISSHDSNFVLLGRILEPHGLKGEVKIATFTEVPEDIAAYGALASADGQRILEIASARPAKGAVVIAKIKGVGDRTAAEALRGLELFVDRQLLPKAEEEEFYHIDLIGLKARDVSGHDIGTVIGVHNFGAGDLLDIRIDKSRQSELILFNKDTVPTLDIAAGYLVLAVPFEDGEIEADD